MDKVALQGSGDGAGGGGGASGISVLALFMGQLAGHWPRGGEGDSSFTSTFTSGAASYFTSVSMTSTASTLTSVTASCLT
jgi:hypothetical protein